MQVFVTLGADRRITGCYPDDMFNEEDRPTGCVEITEDVWTGWLADQSKTIGVDLSLQAAPAATFNELRAAKLRQIAAKVAEILALGAPADGLHIALDDGTRGDMGSMATTALAVMSGAVTWPEGYAKGWITLENTRIPLPAPSDGLTLAAGVGAYYSSLIQNGRDLKDAVLGAADSTALDAIDITIGWP